LSISPGIESLKIIEIEKKIYEKYNCESEDYKAILRFYGTLNYITPFNIFFLLDTLIKDRNDCDVMPFRVNDDDKNALYVLFMTKHRFMDKLLNLKGDFKKAIYIAVYYGYLDIIKFFK